MSGMYLSLRELAERSREHPVRRSWMPLEYRTSWWVPVQGPMDGRLYLAVFFYAVTTRPGEPARFGRPQYHGTLDPVNGQFVEVTDCAYRDFAAHLPPDPIVGTLTAGQTPPRTAEEWDRLRDELYAAYDALLPVAFCDAAELSEEQRLTAARFRSTFGALVEPFMLPYYEALNPAFFEWLNRVT